MDSKKGKNLLEAGSLLASTNTPILTNNFTEQRFII